MSGLVQSFKGQLYRCQTLASQIENLETLSLLFAEKSKEQNRIIGTVQTINILEKEVDLLKQCFSDMPNAYLKETNTTFDEAYPQ